MPSEQENAYLCYTLLKQLDLKPIDWKQVALDNDIITVGAAKKRFARYKAQVDSEPGPSNATRPKKRKRATTTDEDFASPTKVRGGIDDDGDVNAVKVRQESPTTPKGWPAIVKDEEKMKEVKSEPTDDDYEN